jgi:hypothetical protein
VCASAGPLVNEPCRIEGLGGDAVERNTDGAGRVAFEVPVHVREVRVSLHEGRTVIPLLIGHMDPLSEPSGVRAKLANLGHRAPCPPTVPC